MPGTRCEEAVWNRSDTRGSCRRGSRSPSGPAGQAAATGALRRASELEWWREQGVFAIVSGLPTRHCLGDYVDRGFAVRWHPLRDPEQARQVLPELVRSVQDLLDGRPRGAVLVHCDRANEWLAGIDAALRLALGIARTRRSALRAAATDGLPVGSIATSIVGCAMSAAA